MNFWETNAGYGFAERLLCEIKELSEDRQQPELPVPVETFAVYPKNMQDQDAESGFRDYAMMSMVSNDGLYRAENILMISTQKIGAAMLQVETRFCDQSRDQTFAVMRSFAPFVSKEDAGIFESMLIGAAANAQRLPDSVPKELRDAFAGVAEMSRHGSLWYERYAAAFRFQKKELEARFAPPPDERSAGGRTE